MSDVFEMFVSGTVSSVPEIRYTTEAMPDVQLTLRCDLNEGRTEWVRLRFIGDVARDIVDAQRGDFLACVGIPMIHAWRATKDERILSQFELGVSKVQMRKREPI